MKYISKINIMPNKALLDRQGKAVGSSLDDLGLEDLKNVRIGKHISMEVEAENKESAKEKITEACEKLLCNKVMEYYDFTISESND